MSQNFKLYGKEVIKMGIYGKAGKDISKDKAECDKSLLSVYSHEQRLLAYLKTAANK